MKTAGFKPIAQRYAKALFDVAEGQKALSPVEADLAALAAAYDQSAELRKLAESPLIGRARQAEAMEALLTKSGAHKLTVQFARSLALKKRLPLLPLIAEIFGDMAMAARGEMKAGLITAAKAGKDEITLAAEKLSAIFGRKVNVAAEVDPALIGGAVIRVGSQQLDGSIAGKLARLGQRLKAV